MTQLVDFTKTKFPPILVLMNINGLLVHRTADKINFISRDGTQRFVKYCRQGKNFVYFREGYMAFLKHLMDHPRVQFAFYSSIMRKNIMPIITKMFENDMLLFQERMSALFDQEYTRAAPEITGKPYGMIRDLEKVWQSANVKRLEQLQDCSFGLPNTLMLETEEIEVYLCHENSLVVDQFEREDVWPDSLQTARDQVKILTSIKQDLFALLDTC